LPSQVKPGRGIFRNLAWVKDMNKKSILVVEDEEDIQQLVATIWCGPASMWIAPIPEKRLYEGCASDSRIWYFST